MVSLKHKFESAKADGTDATLVKPSNWNDEHDLTTTLAGVVLGRDTSAPGDAQELPIAVTPAGDVTFTASKGAFLGAKGTTAERPPAPGEGMFRYNSELHQFEGYTGTEWVAIRVGPDPPPPVVTVFKTGDIKHTLDNALETGFIYLNGQTLGFEAASGADKLGVEFQPLYEFFWNKFVDTLCVVTGGRGLTSAADFAANKKLAMLDARGRVLAGADNMGTVASADRLGNTPIAANPNAITVPATLGVSGGSKSQILNTGQIPDPPNATTIVNTSVQGSAFGTAGGGGQILYATSAGYGGGTHNNVQATLVCNVLVKL